MKMTRAGRRSRRREHPALSGDPRKSTVAVAVAMAIGIPQAVRAQQVPSGGLQEVIVTATRRAEAVEDIPYNISAVSGNQIEAASIKDLKDISRLVPGLQSVDLGARVASTNSTFVIRGLNTNDQGTSFAGPRVTAPLVSTYIDEVPLFVNLHLSDIERVEVLRGPQGTLYGSGSVGGTVRILHNAPNTERTELELSVRGSSIDHSGRLSSGADAVLNLPLNERLAWRLSSGYDSEAGYIHANRAVRYDNQLQSILADPANPVTSAYATESLQDINSSNMWYARNTLLWKTTDSVKTELVYHHEQDKANGFSTQTPGQPRYTTQQPIPVQPIDRKVDMASLTVTAEAGFATLTSSTSWYKNAYTDTYDVSGFEYNATALPGYYGGYPRATMINLDESSDRSFVQEFRLVSNGNGPWDWIAGLFYQDEHVRFDDTQRMPGLAAWSHLPGSAAIVEDYFGVPRGTWDTFANYLTTPQNLGGRGDLDPSTVQPVDTVYQTSNRVNYREVAPYANLGYKITPAWEVTIGGRAFWDHFSQDLLQRLPLCGPGCSATGADQLGTNTASVARSFHSQIFKLNTSYRFRPDTNGYVTVSQGYRHGGANALCATPNGSFYCYSNQAAASLIPYDSDKAINYELGLKGLAWTHRLRYSVALYRIDWKRIQLEEFSPVTLTTLVLNGNTARTQGVEGELTAEVRRGLSVTLGFSYTDAKLTSDFNEQSFVGRKGDRLPSVSKNTVSAAVDYLQSVAWIKGGIDYHVDAAYRSGFSTALNDCVGGASGIQCPGIINGTRPNFAQLSGFTVLNASISFNLSDQLQLRAFGTNLTNQLGVTAQNAVELPPLTRDNYQWVMQPRTIGIEARYQVR